MFKSWFVLTDGTNDLLYQQSLEQVHVYKVSIFVLHLRFIILKKIPCLWDFLKGNMTSACRVRCGTEPVSFSCNKHASGTLSTAYSSSSFYKKNLFLWNFLKCNKHASGTLSLPPLHTHPPHQARYHLPLLNTHPRQALYLLPLLQTHLHPSSSTVNNKHANGTLSSTSTAYSSSSSSMLSSISS